MSGKMAWADEGRVVALAVQEMGKHGVGATPGRVEHAVNAVGEARNRAAGPEEREVVGLFLAPSGELVKAVQVGAPEAQQFAEPVSPWATHANEDALLPTLAPMSEAEFERLRDEAIKLRQIVADVATPFTERTRAETRLAGIEAKLRAAGRWDRLGMGGVQQSQHADDRPGRARGVSVVERRRRELELQRELVDVNKRLRHAMVADFPALKARKEAIEQELQDIERGRQTQRDREQTGGQ